MRSWRRWRPVLGACSAIWTFEYEEYDKDSEEYKNFPDQTGKLAIVNHEIDIELPTANADFDTPTFRAARFNTYEMENRSKSHFQTLPEAVDDGQWHTYRFDWHTGDANEQTAEKAPDEALKTAQEFIMKHPHIPASCVRSAFLAAVFETGRRCFQNCIRKLSSAV